jgi:hypothetical protein
MAIKRLALLHKMSEAIYQQSPAFIIFFFFRHKSYNDSTISCECTGYFILVFDTNTFSEPTAVFNSVQVNSIEFWRYGSR